MCECEYVSVCGCVECYLNLERAFVTIHECFEHAPALEGGYHNWFAIIGSLSGC